jgi:hypothetical protein
MLAHACAWRHAHDGAARHSAGRGTHVVKPPSDPHTGGPGGGGGAPPWTCWQKCVVPSHVQPSQSKGPPTNGVASLPVSGPESASIPPWPPAPPLMLPPLPPPLLVLLVLLDAGEPPAPVELSELLVPVLA